MFKVFIVACISVWSVQRSGVSGAQRHRDGRCHLELSLDGFERLKSFRLRGNDRRKTYL